MKKILWDRLPPQLTIAQTTRLGIFNYSNVWVRKLCSNGQLPAIKRGKLWVFNTEELKNYFGIN